MQIDEEALFFYANEPIYFVEEHPSDMRQVLGELITILVREDLNVEMSIVDKIKQNAVTTDQLDDIWRFINDGELSMRIEDVLRDHGVI